MPAGEGLRARKKAQTRTAIEDAALDLFAEQGYDDTTIEQIVARADVSITTFFRYFVGKGDVLLDPQTRQLPALKAAIAACPPDVNDMEAFRRGVRAAWTGDSDQARMARMIRAVLSSSAAMGLRDVVGSGWAAELSQVFAERRGLTEPDDRCVFTVNIGLVTNARAMADWVLGDCERPLGDVVDEAFALLMELARAWSR